MKEADPANFAQFPSAGDVVFSLTEVAGRLTLDDKDRILAALVRASGRGDVGDVAVALMLLGLWPGLSLLFARLLRFYGHRKVDLAADIVGRFTACARRLDLANCSRVACTLVLNTERVVRTTRTLELQKEAALVGVDDEFGIAIVDPVGERANALVEVRAWLRKAVPRDVDLVCAIVVDGRDCHDVANVLGVSHAAVRQRLGRALEKIRRTIDESAVTDLGVLPALGGHETRQPVQTVPRMSPLHPTARSLSALGVRAGHPGERRVPHLGCRRRRRWDGAVHGLLP